NLDSPTVSVTQVVPPWPKPRDKTNELPEPDPDREPTPPPTPPPPPRKKEEKERLKAEEEEARRKAEELPPAMPPPPPTPQPSLKEEPLEPVAVAEDEMQTLPPVRVHRRILLTEDARYRFKLRQIRKKIRPLAETQVEITPSEELAKLSNYMRLPDNTEIVRGSSAVTGANALDILPFAAIMAIVTSYKYTINTWASGIVSFVVETAKKLYHNKQENANIDVAGEGATWQLEDVLTRKFLNKYDRGMITTTNYSCAFFKRNGLFYLLDGSACNAMGLREIKDASKDASKGKACCLRILYNKDGKKEDQQFILSRILVRRLRTEPEPRSQLPEDYDYETGLSKSKITRSSIVPKPEKRTSIEIDSPKSQTLVGYQQTNGVYRIEGTTALKSRKAGTGVKSCHFVCLIAMLMATMHPIRTWNHIMVDTCIEKGLEIHDKATNLSVCKRRVIRNVIIDGKFININIKKLIVVNENSVKTLEQYLKAVMRRLRYVIIRFPECNMVICHTEGFYHLFDPYPEQLKEKENKPKEKKTKENKKTPTKSKPAVATWTLYRSMDAMIHKIKNVIGAKKASNPEFYTFELTSIKTAPRHSAINYRLSPLFKPDVNPNVPYLKRRKLRPVVDEKMYWLDIETMPWSRINPINDLGFQRKTPQALWKDWDIEFPGDLYSLWGSVHPLDTMFEEDQRGKQYLATCVVAIVMTQACSLSAWTGSFLDGIVNAGDKYHRQCITKIADKANYEISVNDLDVKFDGMFPYSFTVKFDKIIFGFVYNILPDRFNLSNALTYFFESHHLGLLTSPAKNLSFGKAGDSYFMYDCQSYGAPVCCPGQGASYMLKCESLNRLVYCMTLTLNIRRHGQQFHLYSVGVTLTENDK
ncbi:Uncharacterized protein OBRU01_13219, partial [Operophtera brumata]